MCIKSVDPALELFSRSSLLKRQRIVLRAFYKYVRVSLEEERPVRLRQNNIWPVGAEDDSIQPNQAVTRDQRPDMIISQ